MPSVQLLEIEPDKLFEKYNVSEIETIQQSITKEIEHKKEELRTLVGERYRDLIEAADTIADMKLLSEEVIRDVEMMNGSLASLQKKHKTVKTSSVVTQPSLVKHSLIDEVAAQVKILIDLPELIWSAIDEKDYVRATQLFLFGRHIKTGFKVDKNLKEIGPELFLLERQWCTLSNFPSIILESVERDLKEVNLEPENCRSCLVSIALLENISLVSKFVSLRKEALNASLNGTSNVKDRIVASHDIVTTSVSALYYCFSDSCEDAESKSVWKTINQITGKESPPMVTYFQPEICLKFLPPVITQFRANALNKNETLDVGGVSGSVSDWLEFSRQEVAEKGRALLRNISTLRSLHSLAHVSVKVNPEWGQMLKNFKVTETLDVWNDIYKPIITDRAKELISVHWEEAFSDIKEYISKGLGDNLEKMPELDLRWYVWKESAKDLDLKNTGDHQRGLWLKAKGVSPRVSSMCAFVESKLEMLYSDLMDLTSSEDIPSKESKDLKDHHQNACLETLLRLKEFVRELVNRDESDESTLATLARLLQSMPDLCPGLQKCLTLAAPEGNKMNSWHEAKTLLNAESLSCWSYWEEKTLRRLVASVTNYLKPPETYADLLEIIPQWDVVTIEEGVGEEEVRKSELKTPSAPSLPLQTLLFSASSIIGRAHLPRLIYENLMQKMIPHILRSYPNEVLCQAQALQYLLDFKYLLSQFVPTTNKELTNLCQESIASMESKIDPFDLDVYSPHIHNNVKTNVLKLQALFGMVVFFGEASSGQPVRIAEEPVAISLSKASPNVWFPSLPLTNPANRPVQIMKTKPSIATTGRTGSETEPETSSRTATAGASFFTDWFS